MHVNSMLDIQHPGKYFISRKVLHLTYDTSVYRRILWRSTPGNWFSSRCYPDIPLL